MKNHWSALPRFFLTFYRIVEKLGWKCIQISGTRIWRNYHNHVHIHRGANGFRLRFWLPLSTFRKKIFSFLISLLSMEYPSYYTLAVQLPRSLLRVEKSVCLSVFARVFGRVCVSLCLCVRACVQSKKWRDGPAEEIDETLLETDTTIASLQMCTADGPMERCRRGRGKRGTNG